MELAPQKKKYLSVEYIKNEHNETLNPSLVVFPFNHPKLETLNDTEQTTWQICQNREKKLKDDKYLVGQNNKIFYEAKSKPGHNLSDYVLGVYCKRKRDLKFIDIDSIFPMSQKIRKVEEYSHKMETETLNPSKPDETQRAGYLDKLELINNFGTTKAQKIALNMKTNIVTESNISSVNAVKKILEENAKSQESLIMTGSEEQEKNKILSMMEILPGFNLETAEENKVFQIQSIIDDDFVLKIDHKGILKMLKANGKGLEENKHLFSEGVYDLLKLLVPKVRENKKVSNKIKYSMYLNEMIKFFLLPKVIKDTPEHLAQEMQVDQERVELLLKLFTEQSYNMGERLKYIKTPTLILKNVYYILILALIIHSFEFDYASLARSMRLELKQVVQYYKEIGCTFSSGKASSQDPSKKKPTIVKFKAPLKLNLLQKNFSSKK